MGGIYWLASYPKSGNTWFRAVLANYMSDSEAPVGINELNTGAIASSRGWVDDVIGFDTADLTQAEVQSLRPQVYRWASRDDAVGYHKIHDAYSCDDDGRPLVDDLATLGAIYLVRNPLDVAPSLANHNGIDIDGAISLMANPNHALARGTKSLKDQLLQVMGTWSDHVNSWTRAPDLNLMILRYEDMLAKPTEAFGQALTFLGLSVEATRLARAIGFSTFEALSSQEAQTGFRERPGKAERFFREGRAGSWRETLTSAHVDRIIGTHHDVMTRFGYLDAEGNLPLP
ncbi:sulfotransferase [Thioclava sp. JM3]|uniref:sulfotransferase domain-containing protein n=1 Tax=Thioclava sp. JM3 TaxID=1973004 RepID=UPI000B545E15|nr:sulfotransferase domain-containing protein [Thioclava sp. JM3]OWY14197.1 sulfotransferase [Thioclava sp. JM3]